MRAVSQYGRLVAIGCSTVVIGGALATFGVVSSSGDWILAALGGIAAALGLLLVVTALVGMRRTAPTTRINGQPSTSNPVEIGRAFVRRARSSRRQQLIAILYLVWFVYNAVALVVTLVRHQWALSLVYAALTAVVPVLVYVRAATPTPPNNGGPSPDVTP
jgi:hypothetical protein